MYNTIVKIGIEVTDMEKSLDFYTGTLGMKLMERFPQKDGGECVFINAGSVILELMTPKAGKGPLHHIAVGVDDTDKAIGYFKSKGVPVTMEHIVVEDTIHLADVSDPDGIRVRLFKRDAR